MYGVVTKYVLKPKRSLHRVASAPAVPRGPEGVSPLRARQPADQQYHSLGSTTAFTKINEARTPSTVVAIQSQFGQVSEQGLRRVHSELPISSVSQYAFAHKKEEGEHGWDRTWDSELLPLIPATRTTATVDRFPFILTAIACMGSIQFGAHIGFSSPFEDDVLSSTRFSSEQVDLMFSLISIGAILGCFIAGLWSSRYGRRAALICNTIPYIVGSLLMIAGTGSYDLLCVGRLLCGTGVGMSSVLVPLYIAEIASSEMRGSLGAASSVALSLGLILVNCAGLPAVTYPGFWRITLLGTIAMAVVMGVLLITIGVETPRFLLSTGRQEDALHSLRKLRGPSADVEAELHELLDYEEVGVGSLSNDNEPWESTYRRYFASDEVDLNQEPGYSTMAVHFANTPTHSPKALELPSPRLHTQHHQEGTEQIPGPPKPSFFQLVRMKENFVPLLLGVSLQLLQQFSGINAFMFHTKAMLSSSTNYSDDHDSTEMAANNHLDEAAAYIALFGAIGVNTLQLAVGLIAVAIIEKAGRRFWLMFSCFGMGIFSFLLGYVIEVDAPSYAKLLIIMGYVAMFALGVGPIPWLICSEIFPSAIRSNAVAIATTANWMGAFLITASFPFLQRVLGEAQVFWLYGGVVTLGAVYVYFFLPETSGLTLEEIELLFAQQKIAQDVNAPIPF